MTPEEKLRALGLELPPAPKPVGAYVPAVRSGNLIFVSGQLPMKDGELMTLGHVGGPSTTLGAALSLSKGGEVTMEEAQDCARQAVLNALAVVAAEIGGIENVARIVRVTGYVASAPGFTDQVKVLNAASELLADVFGEAGRHSRIAVGAVELPLGAPVELEMVIECMAPGVFTGG